VAVGRRTITSRSRKVRAGESLSVEGEIAVPEVGVPRADPSVPVPVVHADEAVIVVDKPAGLVVHPGNGHHTGTLVHGLLARFPDLAAMAAGDTVERPGIVHRLDKGTSGLLVVARTPAAREDLIGQLSRREMGREYLALVLGTVESDAGLIDAPLGRSDTDPSRIRVQTGGRAARTRYAVEARFTEPLAATLLRCRLETGRTHQIRVHLASIGHPVAGDDRYGGRTRASWPAGMARLPADRPFLHATELSFVHPVDRRARTFSSGLPEDLATFLGTISATAP
jgi:23S rRNA pseudouridine1911/1915/1917 synthase